MRYMVDSALCSAHGQCYAVAPDVYSGTDDGYNSAVGSSAEVPVGREAEARAGAAACPESAITVLVEAATR